MTTDNTDSTDKKMEMQDANPVLHELDYRSPMAREALRPARMEITYRIGLACWLIPLVLGVAIALLWMAFQWQELVMTGIYAIWLGTLLAGVGGICAVTFTITRWRRSSQPGIDALRPGILLVCLLASNFLVAILLVAFVLSVAPPTHGM